MPAKILIVDDDASHRQMIQVVLSDEGYEIHEAEDGETAINGVTNRFYDLILIENMLYIIAGHFTF